MKKKPKVNSEISNEERNLNQRINIKSLNLSKEKGTPKSPQSSIELNDLGISGDAHAGAWHRQVSLLAYESIERASLENNMKFKPGDFAENITTMGMEIHKTGILDRFINDNIDLEITQIGKECHQGCHIMNKSGKCIMPQQGIFCRVIKGGTLKPGDQLEYRPYVFRVHIITLSDRAFRAEYEDKSGPLAVSMIEDFFSTLNRQSRITHEIIPDDPRLLEQAVIKQLDVPSDIIITTGGTGLGPRDITPETMTPLLTREIPGIMEMIRCKFGSENPHALLSRSIAGMIDKTLVYCLPGSQRGVEEYLEVILSTLEHSLFTKQGLEGH
ncbi:MAG: molybdopterin-binding protein [Spirochaetaceae bacterium]|jgi:molybdopterin adenylyltransferase|nr:molybdopterin-binding protein [Spirochaetaceae bacterium]